jgi:DNA invertase Pin-like site-specific DNA recombinase
MTNLDSKRRQYDLVDVTRQHGFVDVEIIDDDLGRSASGTVTRPGFDRLVHGSESSTPWRSWSVIGGRGVNETGVEARVIDLDGVYNPCRLNDRLLLGMKGSISEFELSRAAGENAGCRSVEGQSG